MRETQRFLAATTAVAAVDIGHRACKSSNSCYSPALEVNDLPGDFLLYPRVITSRRLRYSASIFHFRNCLRDSRPGGSPWVQFFNNPLLPHHQSTAVPAIASTSDFIPDSEAARLRHSLPTFTRKYLHTWTRDAGIVVAGYPRHCCFIKKRIQIEFCHFVSRG